MPKRNVDAPGHLKYEGHCVSWFEKMESVNLKILLIGDSGTGKSRYGYL